MAVWTLPFSVLGRAGTAKVLRVDDIPTSSSARELASPTEVAKGVDYGLKTAHGVLMALGWVVLLPAGILVARYAKNINPTTGPRAFWFLGHRILQAGGGTLIIIGGIIGFSMVPKDDQFQYAHSVIGLILWILVIVQIIGGNVRPGHDASWRWIWELGHKGDGYIIVLVAWANIYLGLLVYGAHKAFFGILGAIMGIWVIAYFVLWARGAGKKTGEEGE